jgi:hypothetical protein
MKALTVSQPFASLIASGEKWVENRTWATGYRGPILIHAGKRSTYIGPEQLQEYPTGCILAVADLGACLLVASMRAMSRSVLVPRLGKTIGKILDHAHTQGPWCWVLGNVVAFAEPIPFRGELGLFDVPNDLVADAIARAELGRGEEGKPARAGATWLALFTPFSLATPRAR